MFCTVRSLNFFLLELKIAFLCCFMACVLCVNMCCSSLKFVLLLMFISLQCCCLIKINYLETM
ncbi:hypothetical protein Peur_065534 [Populus x canadensis]